MKRKRRHILVGLGELLWDLLPQGRQMGGAPANFAYHAAAWGERGIVASCVGADPSGRELLRRLRGLGLSVRHVAADPSHPTGTVSVRLDARGVPEFTIHENVAWDYLPWTPALQTLAEEADAVCFGSLAQRNAASRGTIERFLDATGAHCLRILDINLRQTFYTREVIERSLARSCVLKLNDGELPVLAQLLGIPGDIREVLARLRRQFALQMIVLTRGAQGSLLLTEQATLEHPGTRVTVADTVGAGDAFTAAVAVGLLRGDTLADIQIKADRVAAYVCTQAGGTPAMPPALFAV